jgi:hypothetical protein
LDEYKEIKSRTCGKQWEIGGIEGVSHECIYDFILFGLVSIVKSELIKDSKKFTSS